MNIVSFFVDFSSIISKFSIYWTVQEEPGRLLGGVLGDLEGSWGCPGGSGRRIGRILGALGESWGCLGGSGRCLGRVLGGLGVILERLFEQSDFRSIFDRF